MNMNEQRTRAIAEAKELLIDLDNVRKTFKCHKERSGSWDAAPLLSLYLSQDYIIKELERLRKQANLSQEDFQKLVYEGVDFSKENPVDAKTGKVKKCYIRQNEYIKSESISDCSKRILE